MRATTVVVIAALTSAAAVHAATPKQDPAYRVSITGSLTETDTVNASSSGCAPAEAMRTISFHNAAPLVQRASQLAYARNGVFELQATEHRSVTLGYGQGLQCNDDDVGCGTVTYTIGSVGTGVGVLNGKEGRFTLFFTSIKPDPFGGKCSGLNHAWRPEGTPGSSGAVSIVNFPPPAIWAIPPHPFQSLDRPYWRPLTRIDLYSGKQRMIAFTDNGTEPPSSRGATHTMTWTVQLTPVP
ncbi:MAG TPA: hypothetical protein VFM96_07225 [Gaiellaceae bacterium]|nr:hypothetical protein [Gaiellaceae bacterium]